jgi:hypothetical protein
MAARVQLKKKSLVVRLEGLGAKLNSLADWWLKTSRKVTLTLTFTVAISYRTASVKSL